jgi:predicted O-methyltransferase YrrM
LIEKLDGREIDFLLIDGDHRYRGVKKDWQLYSPLVKKNGIIAFHDILFHPGIPSCKVHRLWKEVKAHYRHIVFVDKEDDRGWGQWGGIGLIYN